ncbi:hypothetical protein [Deinococcus sp. Arct2-2]|nr:hypothetical protein [Deinococcus sp. Arct2-2]
MAFRAEVLAQTGGAEQNDSAFDYELISGEQFLEEMQPADEPQ